MIVLQLAKHFLTCLNIIVWHIKDMSCYSKGEEKGVKSQEKKKMQCVSALYTDVNEPSLEIIQM